MQHLEINLSGLVTPLVWMLSMRIKKVGIKPKSNWMLQKKNLLNSKKVMRAVEPLEKNLDKHEENLGT